MSTEQALTERLVLSGAELAVVIGPRDRDCVCLDWVGAVVRIAGTRKGFPSVADAIRDGLFHPGCRHILAAFDVNTVSPAALAEARRCTEHALAAMRARARGEPPPPLAVRVHLQELARAKAEGTGEHQSASIQSARVKFERVYTSARKALAAGDTEKALLKCRAALSLLQSGELANPHQNELIRILEKHIQRLQGAERPGDSR